MTLPQSTYTIDIAHHTPMEVDRSVTDRQIWESFKKGNIVAFEKMYKDYYPLLLNYGLKFNNSEEDVKDFIQLLFTNLWSSRGRLGNNDSIKSYLLASLRRMIHRANKSQMKNGVSFSLNNSLPISDLPLYIENNYSIKEDQAFICKCINKLINELPKRQKEALYLKYYEENSYCEIAEIMNITTRVVYKLVYKAIENLLKRIEENKNLKLLLCQ